MIYRRLTLCVTLTLIVLAALPHAQPLTRAATTASGVATTASGAATIVGPKAYYLSLGDSVAYSGQPVGGYFAGYSDDLYAALNPLGTSQLINMGCPDENTATMIYGGCPWVKLAKYLYTGAQLTAALDFIQQHPGQVSPVTLNLGNNDLNQLFDASTCAVSSTQAISREVSAFDANLSSILSQLHGALNGSGDLLVNTLYVPHENQCPSFVPLFQLFNSHIMADAQQNGAHVAPIFDAFGGASTPNPNLCAYTWMCGYQDIHPTTQGYCIMAASIEATLGYPAPPGTTIPCGSLAASIALSIPAAGGSSSYTFMAGASGPAAIGSCATTTRAVFDLSVYDSSGALLGSGTTPSYCNWVDATVSAGRTYTVTTVAVTGTGTYRSAWSINGAPVVWNTNGTISTPGAAGTVGFPTLSAAPISISTCGPAGTTFALYLDSASGATLASATAPSNCQSLTYTPGARGLFLLQEAAVSGSGAWAGSITAQQAGSPAPTATPTRAAVTPSATPTATTTPLPPSATPVPSPPLPTATGTTTPQPPTSTPPPTAIPATAVPMPLATPRAPTGAPASGAPPVSTVTLPAEQPTSPPSPPVMTPTAQRPASTSHTLASKGHRHLLSLLVTLTHGRLTGHDVIPISIRTSPHAHLVITVELTRRVDVMVGTGKHRHTVLQGKGKHRGKVTKSVLLYRTTARRQANAHGSAVLRMRLAYNPPATLHVQLAVTVRATFATASYARAVTILHHAAPRPATSHPRQH